MKTNPFQYLMVIPVPWMFVLGYLIGIGLETLSPIAAVSGFQRYGGIAGAVVFAVGILIAGWSWLAFFKARTTTVPGKLSSQLVTWGPYRFTRNPMYVGLTLAYLGEAGMMRQCWPVLILPLVLAYVNWIVIPVEETQLREVFATPYDEYCTRVRRWL